MNKRSAKLLLLLTAVFMIISQAGCGRKTAEPVTKQSFYFDTVCSISVYDMEEMSEEKAMAAIDAAFKLCSHYESLLSRTKKDTDIYKINHAQGRPVECDPETVEVIRRGLYYSEFSEGRFDITIGRVSDLWDFHAEEPEVPSKEELSEAAATVDYKNVVVEGSTVRITDPQAHIDLGGIAKGYIADRVGESLEAAGVRSAILSLGGNIVCIGQKPDGSGSKDFRVGIEKPYSSRAEIVGSVPAKDATVVTSGVYQRYFDKDDVRYHHILDASTGYPAQSDIVSVTLKAEKGRSADCDALATILLIMGEERAMQCLEGMEGVEAFLITSDGRFVSTEDMGFEAQ